jgi:hypothetical protein
VSGVSSSRALKWALLILLPLSLGWKLVAYSYNSEEPKQKAEQKAAEFLSHHQFNFVGAEELTGEMPVVRGAAGTCRILIAMVSPRGWHQNMINNMTTSSDRTFFVFDGQVYREQPKLRTILDFLRAKFFSQMGLKMYATPVYAVIATNSCAAEKLPWSELS